MSCPFYYWDSDYCCRKTGKRVNEDIYSKYCRKYDYDDCPIYKGNDSSGGCYLTSACVESKGLPDNCVELMTLRHFRDTWLANQPGGKEEIVEYYANAPFVVSAINALPNSKEIWNDLYGTLVEPCVEWIKGGKMDLAHELYRKTAKDLIEKYV